MSDIALLQPFNIEPKDIGKEYADYRLSDVLLASGEEICHVCVTEAGMMVVYTAAKYSHKKHYIEPLADFRRNSDIRGDDAIIRYIHGRDEPVWTRLLVDSHIIESVK